VSPEEPVKPVANRDRDQRVVLALNSGSSTVKFAAFAEGRDSALITGVAAALTTPEANLSWTSPAGSRSLPLPAADHRWAIESLGGLLAERGINIAGIGHRVVHGGEAFTEPTLIDERVIRRIEQLAPLAPLHNPPNLLGIRLLIERFPDVPQVAVFDTAFHQTLPPQAFHYALPREFYETHRVRRYGFHGTSHQHVATEAARRLNRDLAGLQMITAHLGNGCSACAIRDGRSVDTTMGFTPAEGMMMGTRSGDVDPTLHQFLARQAGLSLDEVTELLNRRGGLLGVSGFSNDRRLLEQRAAAGDERAALALELFCFRAAKAILGMTASLERVEALVFTGGIGENSPWVRRRIIEQTALLGIRFDEAANNRNGIDTNGRISRPDSPVCLVVPTNEELAIARAVWRLLG
jgi:acetate kinase